VSHAAATDSPIFRLGVFSRKMAARTVVKRSIDLHVSGLEHVPRTGATLLAARHYHHLNDAAVILASVERDVHILIAVDWSGDGFRLNVLRWLAEAARWPAIWRSGARWRLNRDGYRESLRLLAEGRLLLVFPQGYPVIDPAGSRAPAGQWLAFDPGVVTLAQHAARAAGHAIPVVPVGLWYAPRSPDGWTVWLRFGQPLRVAETSSATRETTLRELEAAVRCLSGPPSATRGREQSSVS
jgi:1-acyl-sn-glycerol-3-phosphate acyltransferase